MKNIGVCDKLEDKTLKNYIKKQAHLFIDPAQAMQIISDVYTHQKYQKSFKPDEDRKQYANLIQWLSSQFKIQNAQFKKQTQNYCNSQSFQCLAQKKQQKQLQIVLMAMNQFCIILKKECRQKGFLMETLLKYVYQLVQDYKKIFEKQIVDVVKQYNQNLNELQKQFGIKIEDYQQKLTHFQAQKQTKWKNIYMLAKDNRILRRQKGKLLRKIQEQEQSTNRIQHQLLEVLKQNQVNKLVLKFQNDQNNLQVFMKNRIALMKFQKTIQKYPKKAMKNLNDALIKLQIEELNGLDNKMDYIRRVINESGGLSEEYEDLNEMIRPNIMVFNMFTQTTFQQQKLFYKDFVEGGCQTAQQNLTLSSYQIDQKIQNLLSFNLDLKKIDQQKLLLAKDSKLDLNQFMRLKHPYKKNYQRNSGFLSLKRRVSDLSSNYWNNFRSNQNKSLSICRSRQVMYKPSLQNSNQSYRFLIISEKQGKQLDFTNNSQEDFIKQQNKIEIFSQTLPQFNQNQSRKNGKKNKSLMIELNQSMKSNNKKNRKSQMLSLSKIKQTWAFSNDNNNGIETIQQNKKQQQSKNSQSISDSSNLIQQFQKQKLLDNSVDCVQLRGNRRTVTQTNHRVKKISRFSRGSMINFKSANANDNSLNYQDFKTQRNSVNVNQSIRNDMQNSDSKLSKLVPNKGKIIKTLNQTSEIKKNKLIVNRTNSFLNNITQMQNIDETVQQNSDQQNQSDIQSINKNKKQQEDSKSKSKRMLSKLFKTDSNFKEIMRSSNKMKTYNRISTIQKPKFRNSVMNQHSFNFQKQNARKSVISSDKFSILSQNTNHISQRFSIRKYAKQKQEQNQEALKKIQEGDWNIIQGIVLKPFQIKKIVQKIIKSIYNRRKELLNSSTNQQAQTNNQQVSLSQPTLKSFIQSYLKQNYGNNWQCKNLSNYSFTFQDRSQSNTVKIFNVLLNWHASRQYLEDLFRLYIIMLQKNEYNTSAIANFDNYFLCKKQKGNQIMKYLLSVYFDQKFCAQMMTNLPFVNNYQVDLNEAFIAVQNQIRKFSLQTELNQFLAQILPESQSKITFSQMKQIMFIFKFQEPTTQYHCHLARLKYFFSTNSTQSSNSSKDKKGQKQLNFSKNRHKSQVKTQDQEVMPVHRISLYAKRYEWTNLLQINSFIEEKYSKLIGIYIQQETVEFITKFIQSIDKSNNSSSGTKSNLGFCQSLSLQKLSNLPKKNKVVNPFEFLLSRSKQMIHNYYRYKIPLNRNFFMFMHITLVQYRIQSRINQVMSNDLQSINSQLKRLQVKKQIQLFIGQSK